MKRFLLALIILLAACSLPGYPQDAGGDSGGGGGGGGGFDFDMQAPMPGLEDFLPAYPLSVGDAVMVNVYTPTLTAIRAIVDRNGSIIVPPAGRIVILGLTIEEAAARVEMALAPYFKQASVSIDLYRLSMVKVFVFGATDRAGVYQLRGGTTMLEFLQQLKLKSWGQYRQIHHYRFTSFFLGGEAVTAHADGFSAGRITPADETEAEETPAASGQEIAASAESESDMLTLVQRYGARDTIIDPTDFVALGELKSKNFLLRDGDIIYFQLPGKSVSVLGTTRPGVYEVLPGEGLVEIMRRAGDATPENNLRNTLIERQDSTGALAFQIIDLDKYYFSQDEPPVIPLENGDQVKIMPYDQSVTVIGAVNKAGRVLHQPGYTILQYIADAEGGTIDALLEKVYLVRGSFGPDGIYHLASSTIVNCHEYLGAGNVRGLPAVLPGDIIFVPTKDDIKKSDLASILTSVTLTAVSLFRK